MEQTIDRSTMNQKDKEALEKAIVKNPIEMSQEEIGTIRARRAYLSASERVALAEVLKVETVEMGVPPIGTGKAPVVEKASKKKSKKK